MIRLIAILLLIPSLSYAKPYFRLLDPKHIQTDANTLYKLSDMSFVGGITDIALVTHSLNDGTIIPASLQKYISPEPWIPLQVGVGGSLHGNAIIHVGSSYNIGAQLATMITKTINPNNPTLSDIKDFFTMGLLLKNGSTVGFNAGVGLAGRFVENGRFQSFRAMFPKQGLLQNLYDSSCYSLGLHVDF